ncbi:hypothetical protein TSUD_409780 [Trifolium subterraneum]|uniref:Uncharacterized protein n=1 Tax=Trifolium subterraneum TaxID=3900 RepID=A0A2Z6P728_TRISU|nr:hypothetical protein TSUD_409780 [Trifolium subterraneum]
MACEMAWIDRDLKIVDLGLQVPDMLQQACVGALVNEEGDWNWEQLAYWLPENIMQKILAIAPPRLDAGRDSLLVEANGTGGVSVKGIYNQLCHFNPSQEDFVWNSIWRLKVPERVRQFYLASSA